MPITFTTEQITEISRLSSQAEGLPAATAGAYVPVYDYILRTALGLDSETSFADIW